MVEVDASILQQSRHFGKARCAPIDPVENGKRGSWLSGNASRVVTRVLSGGRAGDDELRVRHRSVGVSTVLQAWSGSVHCVEKSF